jgi:hypothetical protein
MDPRRQAGPPPTELEWPWDPRAFYKLWLGAVSQAMEAYLRSAAFLELMQQGLKTMSASVPIEDGTEAGSPATPRLGITVERKASR